MPLKAGRKLGPYEVLSPIGKGGMGEVFRARDTKLERDVAIKVLPDELASDDQRVARFEREAKLLASLNHPNIASIHGIQESDGVKALVLELVEGPTLAERIEQGPIPAEETIAIAKQIALALEAGHEAGVVHRDLKPANVKLKEDGTVKVLDYGLAKALEDDGAPSAGSELSQSPTLTRQGTRVGLILGTAAYMSPEQARGKPVDERADIWSFGAVVYEMVTGRRAFDAEDVSLTLAAVMTADPDLSALASSTPPALETVIRRCLMKDPKERIRDIGDARLAMEGAFESRPSRPGAVSVPSPLWRRALPVAAALVLGGLTTGIATRMLSRPAPLNVARFDVTPEDGVTILATSPSVALSPDGQLIAYMSAGNSMSGAGIHLRSLDRLGSESLVTEMVGSPFFSPDGSQLGFYVPPRGGTPAVLKRVSVAGGAASTITEIPGFLHGASWGADGTIVFATRDLASGLWRVSAAGGEPTLLTTPDEGSDHYWPEILPGSEAVLFTIVGTSEESSQIAVLSLATREQKVLVRHGSFARYSPTGHLLFGRAGALWAVGFDLDRLETWGEPIPVQEGVVTKGLSGAAEFDVSANGTLVYVAGESADSATRGLVWVDAKGQEATTPTPAGEFQAVALSPDGARAAVGTTPSGGVADIWVSNLARGTLVRLTRDGGVNRNPLWSPDGSRIAYGSTRDGRAEVVWQSADGTDRPEPLVALDPPVTAVLPTSWSPDGTMLSLVVLSAPRESSIGVVRVGDPDSFRLFGANGLGERAAVISPDGRWLAYTSFETNVPEVYVQRFPDGGGKQVVSIGGGMFPKWSADGRHLAYLRTASLGPLSIARVTVSGGATPEDSLVFGAPTELFPWSYYAARGAHGFYDMSADGEHFLMIQASAAPPARTILVENWFQELNAKLPAP